MDIDLSQSDLSRLTTMLTRAGIAFVRSYGPNGMRLIEAGPLVFGFNQAGDLTEGSVCGACEAYHIDGHSEEI